MVVGRVANLTIRQQSHLTNPPMTGAVLIKGGAKLMLDECVVTSATGHCVVVQGTYSRGFLTHNLICDAKGVGVLVCDFAHAVIADNEICRNARAGIAILSSADPHVRGNKIHSGLDSGVLVSDKGRGRIEGNDISHNKRACVAILKGGEPVVHNNRIHHGRDSGVLVCEDGKGVVRDNEIFANHMAGIAIGRGGSSRVTGNTIRDSHGGSLCLSLHSKGDISFNVIQHDAVALMQVPDALLPQVRERNTVLITARQAAARPQTHPGQRAMADVVMEDAIMQDAMPMPLPMVH
jgi:F-box protein 11